MTEPRTRRLSAIEALCAEVAEHHRVPVSMIRGPKRHRYVVRARQEFMYRARTETAHSTITIGDYLHRDHSTVIDGSRLHKARIVHSCCEKPVGDWPAPDAEMANSSNILTMNMHAKTVQSVGA